MKGRISFDISIGFTSPITGNGFAGGGLWWSIKAFVRLFPALVWVGSPAYRFVKTSMKMKFKTFSIRAGRYFTFTCPLYKVSLYFPSMEAVMHANRPPHHHNNIEIYVQTKEGMKVDPNNGGYTLWWNK